MNFFSIFLIIFWLIIIKFPEIISYLIGWFFVFLWINILIMNLLFKKRSNSSYVKFWKYKIFKD